MDQGPVLSRDAVGRQTGRVGGLREEYREGHVAAPYNFRTVPSVGPLHELWFVDDWC